ncbi:MAG TPA: GNAT family N-acetyltransferase [Candidatus Cybelea sp.]
MKFSAENATLRTERLELRPQAADDSQAIFEAFASDERVTKYMDWQPSPRLDVLKTQDRYADLAADMAQGKRIAWVIRKLDEERLCGKIELRIDGTDGDIGYVLGVSHWGQGIAPEAVTAALRFALRQGLRRVTGTCDPENRASIRVFEKCGFRHVDRKKAALIRPALSPEPRDSECFELVL